MAYECVVEMMPIFPYLLGKAILRRDTYILVCVTVIIRLMQRIITRLLQFRALDFTFCAALQLRRGVHTMISPPIL